jgi:hypothetical protein
VIAGSAGFLLGVPASLVGSDSAGADVVELGVGVLPALGAGVLAGAGIDRAFDVLAGVVGCGAAGVGLSKAAISWGSCCAIPAAPPANDASGAGPIAAPTATPMPSMTVASTALARTEGNRSARGGEGGGGGGGGELSLGGVSGIGLAAVSSGRGRVYASQTRLS